MPQHTSRSLFSNATGSSSLLKFFSPLRRSSLRDLRLNVSPASISQRRRRHIAALTPAMAAAFAKSTIGRERYGCIDRARETDASNARAIQKACFSLRPHRSIKMIESWGGKRVGPAPEGPARSCPQEICEFLRSDLAPRHVLRTYISANPNAISLLAYA